MGWEDTIKIRPEGWRGIRGMDQPHHEECCQKARAYFLNLLNQLDARVAPPNSAILVVIDYLTDLSCREFLMRLREIVHRNIGGPPIPAEVWEEGHTLRPLAIRALKLYDDCVNRQKQTLGRHFQPAGQ
jgi:hypothetical protein